MEWAFTVSVLPPLVSLQWGGSCIPTVWLSSRLLTSRKVSSWRCLWISTTTLSTATCRSTSGCDVLICVSFFCKLSDICILKKWNLIVYYGMAIMSCCRNPSWECWWPPWSRRWPVLRTTWPGRLWSSSTWWAYWTNVPCWRAFTVFIIVYLNCTCSPFNYFLQNSFKCLIHFVVYVALFLYCDLPECFSFQIHL